MLFNKKWFISLRINLIRIKSKSRGERRMIFSKGYKGVLKRKLCHDSLVNAIAKGNALNRF